MPKIYLDCSATYRSTNNTGIQRVVRNLANESKKLALPAGTQCIPVVRHRQCFRAIEQVPNPAQKRDKRPVVDAAWYRLPMEAFCGAIGSKALRQWFLPEPGHSGIFHITKSLQRKVARIQLRILPRVYPEWGDWLIDLDLDLKKDWAAAERWRAAGVKLGGVIYDLEPLIHPEYFTAKTAGRFDHWLKQAVVHYDLMPAISHTVRDQLIDYLRIFKADARLTPEQITAFHLGSNLDGAAQKNTSHSAIRPEIKQLHGAGYPTTFLTVGTIEPRKNHRLLLDAVEQAWAAGANVRCVFVGRRGWKCEDLQERMESHPELGKRLLVHHDLTDSELHHVYRHSSAFVYPTHAEGFGLPLVEAMLMGLPVLASDLPILRETSGGHATFFDNTSPDALAGHLCRIAAGTERLITPEPDQLPVINWHDSAQQFLAGVLAIENHQSAQVKAFRPSEATVKAA